MKFTGLKANLGSDCFVDEADLRNRRRFLWASAAWATFFVVGTWLVESSASPARGLVVGVTVVTVALGLVAIGTYGRFLSETDELKRRIQLEGIAFGFGIGLLFSLSYQLLESAGAPGVSSVDVGTVMIFGYIGGVLRAMFRYQ